MSILLHQSRRSMIGNFARPSIAASSRTLSVVARNQSTGSTPRLFQSSHAFVAPLSRRCLSSTPPPTTEATPRSQTRNNNENFDDDELVLFRRGTDQFALMRSGLGFSCFHTAYWIWYTTEFIPLVNANQHMPELHIDPMLGVAGICFAGFLQSLFVLLPWRLVSKITYRPLRKIAGGGDDEEERIVGPQLWVYTHRLPAIRPSFKAAVVLDVSSSKDTPNWSWMDPKTTESQRILENGVDGFTGRLLLRPPGSWLPWVLDIREDSDISHPKRLLQALVEPHQLPRLLQRQEQGEDGSAPWMGGGRRGKTTESRLRSISRKRPRYRRKRS